MAELAAVTGAAGLVSLGLQVCGGLVQYYGAWKDFDTQTASFCNRINDLAQTLEVLMSMLKLSPSNQGIAFTTVESSVICCTGAIHTLQELLAKHGPLPSGYGGTHSSTRLRKITYPFKKSDFILCNSLVNDLQSNLGTALHVYQM